MNCINIAVLDDLATIRESVVRNIRHFMFPQNYEFKIREFASAEEYLESEAWKKTDLLFLDIELPNMNGVELSKQLAQLNEAIKIVFLTSYEHYMKNAFGLNVLYYLMKDDIAGEVNVALNAFIDLYAYQRKTMMTFRTDKNDFIIAQSQVIMLYVENRNVYVVTQRQKIKLSVKSLKSFLDELDPSIFIQPNSGCIVNMNFIRLFKGQEIIVDQYEETIIVARRKVKLLLDDYLAFLARGNRI